jgi:DNA-binding transcriptional ArsR family regulator
MPMPKDNGEHIKATIVLLLRKHPEGLTLEELSQIIKVHRQTVTKYVLELKGAEIIYRRWVGSASLNYIRTKKNEGSIDV